MIGHSVDIQFLFVPHVLHIYTTEVLLMNKS